MSFFEKKAYF